MSCLSAEIETMPPMPSGVPGAQTSADPFFAVNWSEHGLLELAPWLEIVAEANAISFFNWHVRPDRLTWNRGGEERMGFQSGTLSSFGQWRRFVAPEDAAWIAADVAQHIRSTGHLHFRYRALPPESRPRIMDAVGHCVYGRHGELERIIGAVRDVTENVETARDLHHLRDQFLRRARLDSVGAVAAGLAHELNQPLSAAANFLAAAEIEARRAENAAVLPHMVRAAHQIELSGDIIRRLRTFLSEEDRFPEWVSVDALVEDALALALPGHERRRVDVRLGLEPGLRVFADRIQLQQVLVNLLHNALGAMAEMPREQRAVVITGCARDERVEIAISDTGGGFAQDLLDRFAERSASLSSAHGMGIGLSICRHIVEAQGGELLVANGVGGGALIRVLLPADIMEDQA
ncbi:PAS fold-containing protein [Sphingomonas gellani]|uniref:histidine kinase n=1 Tax=Sphingomonas gellani TaxID=1166340 RepID=A0A1H8JEK8_9SPHN|nr:ATP-binding protein [Sphingomonas gellani]SEN79179.1 PAS fold-containing protein [Sphingomonas gellani]